MDLNQKKKAQEDPSEQQEIPRQISKVCEGLYCDLSRYQTREEFLQQRATIGYYRSKLLEVIDTLDQTGFDGDNAEGDLYRHIASSQKKIRCAHGILANTHTHPEWLEKLERFIQSCRGHLNLRQAIIRVQLGSDNEATQFCALLSDTGYTFNIAIKLNWNAARSQISTLCQQLSKTMVVEIEGVNCGAHP